MDKLDILFDEQKRLRREIETRQGKMKETFDGYRIFMFATAIQHEAMELQRETNWKWWKLPKRIDRAKCREETIDIWHFLIDLSIELGFSTEDVIREYQKKHAENMKRQEDNY